MVTKYREACVHGRFQPPHNGHVQYIDAAFERCEFLWIGIAHYDRKQSITSNHAKHREQINNNPLTYYERITIMADMLRDRGYDLSQIGFLPFPIDFPDRLIEFVPKHILCFTTICEPWSREKIRRLERFGYEVIILWKGAKRYEGAKVRNSIRLGSEEWKVMVPTAVAKRLRELGIHKRIRELERV